MVSLRLQTWLDHLKTLLHAQVLSAFRSTVLHVITYIFVAGYTLDSLHTSSTGLVAELSLAGAPCDAFGTDIANLTVTVVHETHSR